MDLYVPTAQLKQTTAVLDQEKIAYEVTGKTFSLVVQGKENPKDKYDLMEIVKVVPREVTTYDPAIFGGELGPSDAKQC